MKPFNARQTISMKNKLNSSSEFLSFEALSLRYGWGCFETIKIKPPNIPLFLDEHLERLLLGCSICRIQMSTAEIMKSNILNFLGDKAYDEAKILRLIGTYENGLNFFVSDLISNNLPQLALRLKLENKWKILSDSPLNAFKSCNYLNRYIPALAAKDEGFDDILLINEKNEICETSKANIYFLDHSDNWFTPAEGSGCIPGIIRKILLEKLLVKEISLKYQDLSDFKACFVSNSLIGIQSVSSINLGLDDNSNSLGLIRFDILSFLKDELNLFLNTNHA